MMLAPSAHRDSRTTMTAMPPSVSLSAASADAAAKPQRRNRDELEALAAEFVNSRIHVRPRPPRRMPQLSQLPKPVLAAGAAGLVVAMAVLAWVLWPAGADEPVREAVPVVNEAELWTRRLEAERERKRAELQRSREYLEKMAAVDGALLNDMTAHAQTLAARAEAAPEPAAAAPASPGVTTEPTPKTTLAKATPARPAPEPATGTPAQAPPQQVAKAAPMPAPSAPATSDARPTAAAAAPKCGIHVAELSSSGKLTYADVARMKGARTDDRGHVFTPPLMAAGRPVVFDVSPDGCVRVVRSAGR